MVRALKDAGMNNSGAVTASQLDLLLTKVHVNNNGGSGVKGGLGGSGGGNQMVKTVE